MIITLAQKDLRAQNQLIGRQAGQDHQQKIGFQAVGTDRKIFLAETRQFCQTESQKNDQDKGKIHQMVPLRQHDQGKEKEHAGDPEPG